MSKDSIGTRLALVRRDATRRDAARDCLSLYLSPSRVSSTFYFLGLASVEYTRTVGALSCDESTTAAGESKASEPRKKLTDSRRFNYVSTSVMDKLAYAASNFQLRLAGILMDTWIFFLFVAIAGK